MASSVELRHFPSKMGLGRQKRSHRRRRIIVIIIVLMALLLVLVSILRPVELRSSVWVDFYCPLAQEAMPLEIDREGEVYNTLVEKNEKERNVSTGTEKNNRIGNIIMKNRPDNGIGIRSMATGNNVIRNRSNALFRVFMYDLPAEFHFGMLDETFLIHGRQIWPKTNMSRVPRYPGGLNLQHSVEYWLTLDLLSCHMKHTSSCTVLRVSNWKDADVLLVPFFSSLSYNRYGRFDGSKDKNRDLQEKLVRYLHQQSSWKHSGGKNHIIFMHHPNSLHVAREALRSAMFVVSDFGRYSPKVANVGKDVVAPYKHMVPTYTDDNSSYGSRKTLLYFQGAIIRKEGGMIRQRLYQILKDKAGVHFSSGNTQRDGIRRASRGMRSSKFCLHLAGDTPSSNRLFDAIASHCVPVIISDEIELPFEDELDYSQFCLFVRSQDALRKGFLLDLLDSVKEQEWTRMWMRLKEVDHHFEFQYPSLPHDAVNMVWKSIARKLPSVKQTLHKGKRYSRSRLPYRKSP